jgi:hypothetical protein
MFTLAGFIDDCRAALKDATPELAVKDLLERTMAHPADVEAALGTPRRGKIVSLHRSEEVTILNVIWTPGMAIYPHEHRMWAAIGLYGGREDNTFYRRGPAGLTVAGRRTVETQDVLVLGGGRPRGGEPAAKAHRGDPRVRRRLLRRAAQRVGCGDPGGASLRHRAGARGVRGRQRAVGGGAGAARHRVSGAVTVR